MLLALLAASPVAAAAASAAREVAEALLPHNEAHPAEPNGNAGSIAASAVYQQAVALPQLVSAADARLPPPPPQADAAVIKATQIWTMSTVFVIVLTSFLVVFAHGHAAGFFSVPAPAEEEEDGKEDGTRSSSKEEGSSSDAPVSRRLWCGAPPAAQSVLNWFAFALAFGFNYGSFKTSIAYLSTMFDRETADTGNITNYVTWTVMTLFVSAAVVQIWGRPKPVLVAAHSMWCTQHLLLLLASLLRGTPRAASTDSASVVACVVVACLLGGTAAALAWTAQGVYFVLAARHHAVVTNASLAKTTAYLAASFASLELCSEALCRAFVGLLLSRTHSDPGALGLLAAFCACGALATAYSPDFARDTAPGSGAAMDAQQAKGSLERGLRSGLSSLALLSTSATALLLQPFSFLKGLTEAFIADYVNAELTAPYLGIQSVGSLTAFGVVVGALVTLGSGVVSIRCGRAYVMLLGIAAWTIPSIMDEARTAGERQTSSAGEISEAYLLVYYVGYGVGRGVFDSVNRVLTAKMLPDNLEQGFALMRFGEGLFATITFAICPCLFGQPLVPMLIGFGCLALLSYVVLELWKRGQQDREEEADGPAELAVGH